ncbi:DNA topoisomerase 3-alpha [Medicago truncatula]|nr:DNA topoisomerase 3-alpha [Medicago truncatula]XP_024640901.1 DNA topoisomerase 3-alpha [Medicago truncatula]XP_039690727.1 DNA topoisomerase 3-alpha [Medicago truncatula]
MELEKFAAKYFKMTPKQTMDTAEDLYTQRFISYPRTETDGFSMNTKELRSIVSKQTKHEKWGSYASDLLDSNKGLWRDPRACKHTDHSHPPIHPIKFSNRKESGWKDHQCVLYELIVRHFLACLSEDALVQKTTVEVDLAGQQFFAMTMTLYKLGYRKMYHYESLFLGFSKFPPYTAGGELTPMDLIVKGSTYSSPQNLSDEDLLSRMQQERIGTDSTWHLLINTVIGRKYVERKFDGNTWRYEPTKLGLALFNGYDQMKLPLWKPEMRAKMEKQITMIKNGTATKKDCLRDTG